MSLLDHRVAATSPDQLYDALATESAALVIRRYSTSFGLACRLLEEPVRTHVRNVYALVRVADELVDAPRPGAGDQERQELLDALETETLVAMGRCHSANLVVHAFAGTARECRIDADLVTPFFESMRTDLHRREHDQASFERYVYGSAEVVGLMCLRAFLISQADPDAAYERLAPGARRLGAAFQKLNFLRDLAADHGRLGRSYFPDIDPGRLSVAQRDALLDDIDADLAAAAQVIPELPDGSRGAVRLAHALFADLARRIRCTPVERLAHTRVRVPGPAKARIAARELVRSRRRAA